MKLKLAYHERCRDVFKASAIGISDKLDRQATPPLKFAPLGLGSTAIASLVIHTTAEASPARYRAGSKRKRNRPSSN